jgi:hypothetical protein
MALVLANTILISELALQTGPSLLLKRDALSSISQIIKWMAFEAGKTLRGDTVQTSSRAFCTFSLSGRAETLFAHFTNRLTPTKC